MPIKLPSRLRRLDDALADLPLEDPMLLTELDGYLTGVAVSPEAIGRDEWLPVVWGGIEAGPPFDDAADVRWFADAVTARYDEIVRDLARGKPRPIYDVDDRSGDLLWEPWIDGFAQAVGLRPGQWDLAGEGDGEAPAGLPTLSTLIAIARDDSDLDSVAINAVHDLVPAAIATHVARLYGSRATDRERRSAPPKVGRNEPCPCGSGRKAKKCCGAS